MTLDAPVDSNSRREPPIRELAVQPSARPRCDRRRRRSPCHVARSGATPLLVATGCLLADFSILAKAAGPRSTPHCSASPTRYTSTSASSSATRVWSGSLTPAPSHDPPAATAAARPSSPTSPTSASITDFGSWNCSQSRSSRKARAAARMASRSDTAASMPRHRICGRLADRVATVIAARRASGPGHAPTRTGHFVLPGVLTRDAVPDVGRRLLRHRAPLRRPAGRADVTPHRTPPLRRVNAAPGSAASPPCAPTWWRPASTTSRCSSSTSCR